jgi:tRNA(adenine34) deaminase
MHPDDSHWMQLALEQARLAAERGEVPVGAVVVRDGELLGLGHNQPITAHDPTAHAEIVALRAACAKAGNYRLPETTLYVTIEPCSMCVGAMMHARVGRLVYGAPEPRAGAVQSALQLAGAAHFNHRLDCVGGVLAQECGALMRAFFRARRTPAAPE